MPEGHTIHRYARLHRRHLGGRTVTVASPQGRFSAGAARLDGRTLDDVAALGKHLLYRWSGGTTLHVHLGLFGKFRTFKADPPPPTEGTRLAMVGDNDVTIYLAGPTICRLLDPGDEETLRRRIGPDPLAGTSTHHEFASNLARRKIPIGAALLDQKVVAGIGNVYRAEVLFLNGISPHLPALALDDEAVARLWDTVCRQLRRGERSGRIVTTDPAEFGASRPRDLRRDERLYVYKRDGLPCRRCGTEIRIDEMGGRSIWYCPRCQP